ncbi:MAG: DNA-directed RNA polymerase subunit H [Candidatus Woesearchaeota archaeon]
MARKKRKKQGFQIKEHVLVPKLVKLSESQKEEILKKYNVTIKELPKISINDPSIQDLNVKPGDIVKIERDSPTAGKALYFRAVTEAQ